MTINSSGTVSITGTNLNMNSTYIDFSGSISTPSTAAAIYRPADNTLAFSTLNTERLRIGSDGKVDLNASVAKIGNSHSSGTTYIYGHDIRFTNEDITSTKLVIDSSGRVMIGVSSTSHASGNTDDLCVGNNDSSSEHGITIGSNAAGGIRFADSASGSAGILEYIHGTANLFKMAANGTADTTSVLGLVKPNGPSQAATTMITFESGNQARGQIKSSSSDSGSPSFAAYSDYRMKENIRDYTGGWNNIKAVPVKLFDITTDGSKDQKGWIAHELQAVLPDLVQGTKDAVDEDGNPIYQSVSMGLFMPDVISALQTAIAKIETLETKVAALEAG